MSSAPASIAFASTSSSDAAVRGIVITPRFSKIHATDAPMDPPALVRTFRISDTVRLRLSVWTSISTATPPGPMPS